MGVDEAGHDDLVAGVDDLVGRCAEIAAGRLDGVAANKQFAAFDLANVGIERDQPAALDQDAFHISPL